MGTRAALNLSDVARDEVRALMRQPRTPRTLADRCRVVLPGVEGLSCASIAAKIDMRAQTVLKWRKRFLARRPAGLSEKPRPGIKEKITGAQVAEVVRMTLEKKPPDARNENAAPFTWTADANTILGRAAPHTGAPADQRGTMHAPGPRRNAGIGCPAPL